MFNLPLLHLPEHVQINLDPNPDDGGKTFVLLIQARPYPGATPIALRKTIPRDVGAIQFGRDMMAAINSLYQQITKMQRENMI